MATYSIAVRQYNYVELNTRSTVRPNRPEDQHFVPAGYLRGFLPDGEQALFVHRRAGTNWFRTKPENIATRKNFYSILRKDGSYDDKVEHMLARYFEAPGLKAVRRLKEGEVIPGLRDREMIATFLSLQYARIPQIRENVHAVLERLAGDFSEHMLSDVERVASELQKSEWVDREAALRKARELARLYKSGDIYLKVKNEASLGVLFSTIEDAAAILADMYWTIYVANDPVFFTSDCPVYISPPSAAGQDTIGIGKPGAVVHVPVSSRRFLVMSGWQRRRQMFQQLPQVLRRAFVDQLLLLPPVVVYRSADAALIRELNDQTAACAGDWICGPLATTDMEHALRLPQVRTELQVIRGGGAIRVDQRMVTDARRPER